MNGKIKRKGLEQMTPNYNLLLSACLSLQEKFGGFRLKVPACKT